MDGRRGVWVAAAAGVGWLVDGEGISEIIN